MRNQHNISVMNRVWLEREEYPHDKNKLNVSNLGNPIREIIIKKNFWPQLSKLIDISDGIKMAIGRAVHKDRAYAMADSKEIVNPGEFKSKVIIEKRYETIINGHILTGQPDMIAPKGFFPIFECPNCNKLIIEDLKCGSIWKVVNLKEALLDFRLQLSAYRYILYMQKPQIIVDDTGLISALCWDWTEYVAEKNHLTGCAFQEIPVDLYPIPEIEKIIWDKIESLKPFWNCKNINKLPECTHEERIKFNKYKDGRYKKCATYCSSRYLCPDGQI